MHRDRNTYRTAFDYLEQHGDTAPIFAAMEADARLEQGNMDGAAMWRRVVKAIHELTGMEGTRH